MIESPVDRVFLLSLGRRSRIVSVDTDGGDERVIVDDLLMLPDGLAIDPLEGSIFYTLMGRPRLGEDHFDHDGSVVRADLDGANARTIVPAGKIVTGKQIVYEPTLARLYFCDREGMRVMSCRKDGSDLVTHVQTGHGEEDALDRRRHCVGVAVDAAGAWLYWTQKGPPKGGRGQILRAPLLASDIDPRARTDVEVLADGLPEPIDLEWDGATSSLYWTDRGSPPDGNTLNRARVTAEGLADHAILLDGLEEAIGIALGPNGRRVFVSDLSGALWRVDLDEPASGTKIYQGRAPLCGIAYCRHDAAATPAPREGDA